MALFRVRVTRDVTESVDIDVYAETKDEANDLALDVAKNDVVDWQTDDGNDYEPFVSDPQGTEEIMDDMASYPKSEK
jgi:aromatic ring hydroxylase